MTMTTAKTAVEPGANAPPATGDNTEDDDDYDYAPSSILSCPPLVRLQAFGLCCGFLETEEERDARVGVHHLHHYPITWYRTKRLKDVADDVKAAVPGAGGLVDGLGQMLGAGKGAAVPLAHHPVPATLTVADSDAHGPTLEVRTLDMRAPSGDQAVRDYITGGRPWWEDPALREQAPAKTVPLYLVHKIATNSWSMAHDAAAGGVRLYAASPETKAGGFLQGMAPGRPGHELLRFDTLGRGGGASGDEARPVMEPNKYSEKVVVQLKSLVDWNRRRIARDITRGRAGVAPKSNSSGYVVMT